VLASLQSGTPATVAAIYWRGKKQVKKTEEFVAQFREAGISA